GGSASSTLTINIQPIATSRQSNAGLKTAESIFSTPTYGENGKEVVLSVLAEAAYHLDPTEVIKQNVNDSNPVADKYYSTMLPAGMRLLTANDLPSLSIQDVLGTPDFPNFGITDGGIYLNNNAAALA